MKPFIILFWRHLFIFAENVSSISFLPLTAFLRTVFNHNPGLSIWFLFFSIAFQSRFQDVYHIRRKRCVLCLDVCKVLIFFIVKLNKNSSSISMYYFDKDVNQKCKFTAPNQLLLSFLREWFQLYFALSLLLGNSRYQQKK